MKSTTKTSKKPAVVVTPEVVDAAAASGSTPNDAAQHPARRLAAQLFGDAWLGKVEAATQKISAELQTRVAEAQKRLHGVEHKLHDLTAEWQKLPTEVRADLLTTFGIASHAEVVALKAELTALKAAIADKPVGKHETVEA